MSVLEQQQADEDEGVGWVTGGAPMSLFEAEWKPKKDNLSSVVAEVDEH